MTSRTNLEFEFTTTPRIVFGAGSTDQLSQIVPSLGSRLLLVTGANPERFSAILHGLEGCCGPVEHFQVSREPRVEDIEEGLSTAKRHQTEVVVAIGGGSVLDAGKAIAGAFNAESALPEYLEVIGAGKPLERCGLACVAVPTTFGTGAEVTRNSVLDVPSHNVKVSLRSPHLLPRVAIVDPKLSCSVPREITAATGFDALTQVIEPYVSNRANPMTDALALAAIARARTALPSACCEPLDIQARSDMALVSLWGGMCLANARLGAVHGFAGPLGGMLHAPHGAICAALLGPVTRVNVAATRRRADAAEALCRYQRVASTLTGNLAARAEDAADWVDELSRELGIRRLGELGLTRSSFEEAVDRATRASSMQGNPIRLERSELIEILELAF